MAQLWSLKTTWKKLSGGPGTIAYEYVNGELAQVHVRAIQILNSKPPAGHQVVNVCWTGMSTNEQGCLSLGSVIPGYDLEQQQHPITHRIPFGRQPTKPVMVAPTVPKPPPRAWLPRVVNLKVTAVEGEPETLGAINSDGQPWNNVAYKTCIGFSIQKCGEVHQADSFKLKSCIDLAQQTCINIGLKQKAECEARRYSPYSNQPAVAVHPFSWFSRTFK